MKRSLLRCLLAQFACVLVLVQASVVHVPASNDANHRNRRLVMRGGNVDTISPGNQKVLKRFGDNSRMPSLFAQEDGVYDKYAACLAATEGLRRLRDQELANEIQRSGASGSIAVNEGQKHITAQYVQNAGKVLQALGMSITQFNELGRTISQNEGLKEKVSEKLLTEVL